MSSRKAYKYRLNPTKAQAAKLDAALSHCRELYNAALEERSKAYQMNRKSVSFKAQSEQLPAIKELRPEFEQVYSQVLQDVLHRVDKAFDNFFRRCKRGETPGYPRFRSRDRYDSFTYPQLGFRLDAGKLKLSKIGTVKVKQHRSVQGRIKTCTIKREGDKWYAVLTCEVEPKPLPSNGAAIGIDVGLESFATFSNGEQIPNPRFFRQEEKELAKAQRKLSATPRRSKERAKRKKIVRRIHSRIRNKRNNFAHQESRKLVNEYGAIFVEDLNVKGLAGGMLAKSVTDAAWSQFLNCLTYKAADAGRVLVKIDPRFTSQDCNACGKREKKSLAVRWHACECGFETHRDHNAALNILAVGLHSLQQYADRSPRL